MKKLIILLFSSLILLQGCDSASLESKITIAENVMKDSAANQKNVDIKKIIQTKLTFKQEAKTEEEKLIESYIVAETNGDRRKLKDIFYPAPHNESITNDNGKNFENVTEELTILKMWQLPEAQWREQIMKKGPSGDVYNDNVSYYPCPDRLIGHNFKEIKVLAVNKYKKCTEEFDKIGQFTSGEYTDFYVLIKENDSSTWKIFDTYMNIISLSYFNQQSK
ncbi:DUF4829 domain-containing protein [Clostridium sp. YIM B02505]|uniref:DUF4829 domain-containing protein n=1 Tax=Clostridium yunnanense TaxID=2800325 RepID=A0ABS1EKM0_9CLOT|nr:DUF4829 domain-containing protein [Clostridium yunnanense]MBK1809918.1 DUF4829 domain-containing protein [Clostridium yunnanense]